MWNTEGEDKVKWSQYYPANLTDEQWREGWHKLQTSNTYDLPYIGDLAIVACAHSLKKDILVFNTPWQINDGFATDPISVVSPNQFDPSNKRDTEIPIVLLYDGGHFESSIPVSEEDVQETINLVRNYTSGKYIIPESLKNDYKSKEPLVNENGQNAQHDKLKKTKKDVNMKSSENDFGKKKGSYTKENDLSSDTINQPTGMTTEQRKQYDRQRYLIKKSEDYLRMKKQNERDQKKAEDNYIIPESLKNDYKSKESLVNENRQNAQHDKPEKTRNDANMKSSIFQVNHKT